METLYTIPVNMAFEECADSGDKCCPFCRLYSDLEDTELEYILGASMMEPDVRVKTNEMGFCSQHFNMMLGRKNRLPFALMMESHLMEIDKHSSRMGFVDRFSGTVIITGTVSEVEASLKAVMDFCTYKLHFTVCDITKT